jgi:type II secretory pathway pseudopilin PulG
MNKKSFILLTTLILIFIFSILAVYIFEVKSLNSQNIIKQYKYIQAKNHINFLDEYIQSLSDLNLLDKIAIEDDKFSIYAIIEKEENKYKIDLYVKSIDFDVSLHKKIIREIS